ncbi:uncharacterized protein LOC123266849 isoform X1 [Cotesia glomerata]|uniref:uncharacterized protein LOC123266849 isoform X1 n=1 Tax=Cotesia glomerata TaxID=32391 RepID=UPI001D01BA45|nr:uncharacterized protein LOC123266849 isoform X1 [Cotesia glomerata]
MELWNKFGYNLARYCPIVSNITKNITLEKKGIIFVKYNQLQNLKRYINDYKFYNSCGKRALTEQLFNNFYQQMVTTYLKEYVIRYYLDVINRQRPKKNLIRTKMDEFIVINKLQNLIKSFNEELQGPLPYLYRCDPPNYDNTNETKYYKLTRMIQASIVKEKDLDIHKSCRHNCDIDTIKNSMNLTVCQGYRRCQYVGKSFEICEMPDSDQSGRKYQ